MFNNAGILDELDYDAITTPSEVIDRTLSVNLKVSIMPF